LDEAIMADHPLLTIHTDGASRGNPGDAACAFVIARPGQPAIEVAERLGLMTNNQAEYTALVRALEHALELGAEHSLLINSDSELMVKQMRGEYRVKNEELRELYAEARGLVRRFLGSVRFQHVRRAQNSRADALCNEVLDGKRPSTPGKKKTAGAVAAPPLPLIQDRATRPTLRDQALARLGEAARHWSNGSSGATAEQVWDDLVRLLEQHGVKVP
jgi:ribonuclease HI